MKLLSEATKGLIKENPSFVLVLGMCTTLAVSTSVDNALGMGAAATFVLICSNIIISLIKGIVPSKIRIPIYIVVIAAFVSIVDMVMAAFLPDLHKSPGLVYPAHRGELHHPGPRRSFCQQEQHDLLLCRRVGMGAGFYSVAGNRGYHT
jgi:electron transport complex protein RnfE